MMKDNQLHYAPNLRYIFKGYFFNNLNLRHHVKYIYYADISFEE